MNLVERYQYLKEQQKKLELEEATLKAKLENAQKQAETAKQDLLKSTGTTTLEEADQYIRDKESQLSEQVAEYEKLVQQYEAGTSEVGGI